MTLCPTRERLAQFLGDALPPADCERVTAHIELCAACQRAVEQVVCADAPAVLREYACRQPSGAPEGVSPHMRWAASTRADSTADERTGSALSDPQQVEEGKLPEVPGHELLEEIGRGGMGVVYKARQRGLDRLVAIKMLAAGRESSDDHQRMRSEAEAAARLHHPHIVQIYEIGDADGKPFLALEYMDHGSLAGKLAGQPQPVEPAARLTAQLARAVHYAHQQGILHRDLKPANVLLRSADAPVAEGHWLDCTVAKIADFGLAKRLDREGTRTHSGAILGTPGYMAPEQAQRDRATLDATADVYGIGAILYELLTGRPPFRGETVMDTLVQVVHVEPLAPRRLRAGLPRDLETICLKCLQKDPARRYASCADLADDLDRFLAGRPIQARPPGPVERSVRWCRRNPMIAGLAAALLLAIVTGFALVSWQWHEADDSFRRAEQETKKKELALKDAEESFTQALTAVDKMLTRVAMEQLESAPRMDPVRLELAQDALAFYEEFHRKRPDDSRVQRELALAHKRVGIMRRLMGQYDAARQPLERAAALQERLAAAAAPTSVEQEDLAATLHELGIAHQHAGNWSAAQEAHERAVSLQLRVVDAAMGGAEAKRRLAVYWEQLALARFDNEKLESADEAYRRSVDVFHDLVQTVGADQDRMGLARAWNSYGDLLEYQGRTNTNLEPGTGVMIARRVAYPTALLRNTRRVIAALEPLAQAQPADPDHVHAFAMTHFRLAQASPDPATLKAALLAADTAQALHERLAREFPERPEYRRRLVALGAARTFMLRVSAPAAAEAACGQARAVGEKLLVDFPKSEAFHGAVAGLTKENVSLLCGQKRYEEALALLEPALARRAEFAPTPLNMRRHRLLDALAAQQFYALISMGNHQEAARIIEGLPTLSSERAADLLDAVRRLGQCLKAARADEQLTAAAREQCEERYLDQAATLLRRLAQRDWQWAEALDATPIGAVFVGVPLDARRIEELQRLATTAGARTLAEQRRPNAALPDRANEQLDLVRALLTLGRLQLKYQPTAAADTLRQADSLARKLNGDANTERLVRMLLQHGQRLRARDQLEAARDALRWGIRLQQQRTEEKTTALAQRKLLHELYFALAEALVQLHDHQGAAEAAVGLAQAIPADGAVNARAARYLSRCVALAHDHAHVSERAALAQEYGDRAMFYLQKAVSHGFKDAAQLRDHSHFTAVRSRADFQQILSSLQEAKK